MERAGIGRRLPAAVLDGLFLSILIALALFVYSIAGGLKIAVQLQESVGMPITPSTIASEEVWEQFEAETQAMFAELEQQIEEDFTDEQAEFIARTMADTAEGYFDPEDLSLEFILSLDAGVLNDVIDESFDAVIAADRPDIDAAEVNELRAEVKQVMDRFALGRVIPAAIRFAVWFVLLPVLVVLVYSFAEAIWGRTLGKLALGIVIGRETDDGSAVPSLMLRYAVKYSPLLFAILAVATRIPLFVYLSGVTWVVVLLGSLVMIGPERRAIHDYIAGTAVYERERRY
ncbi:MAG: RDD family protein [Spirochaetota bacterium]